MSDEADQANDQMEMLRSIAERQALEKGQKMVKEEPMECMHCEEHPRPMIVGKTGHPHRAANCTRCMDELGMQYELATDCTETV